MQAALGELDLLPLQVAHLRGAQAMTVGHQDHGRVAMPVAAMLAGTVHQLLDLALGEVAALDCQVYDAWGTFLGCRFHADKPFLCVSYCICYIPFLNSSINQVTALGTGPRPMLVPLDEWAASSSRYERDCSVSRETGGWGDFWISKNRFGPCSKNLAENHFWD